MEATFISVLIALVIFLLYLYLEQRRKVSSKRETIKGLAKENYILIEKLHDKSISAALLQQELTTLKEMYDKATK